MDNNNIGWIKLAWSSVSTTTTFITFRVLHFSLINASYDFGELRIVEMMAGQVGTMWMLFYCSCCWTGWVVMVSRGILGCMQSQLHSRWCCVCVCIVYAYWVEEVHEREAIGKHNLCGRCGLFLDIQSWAFWKIEIWEQQIIFRFVVLVRYTSQWWKYSEHTNMWDDRCS